MKNVESKITLEFVREEELEDLKKKIQEAFVKEFGQQDGPIPDDEDIDEAFHAPDAVVYHLVESGHACMHIWRLPQGSILRSSAALQV